MGRRGPGALPQARKREQYARLIAQGYNNSEACRIVGINRRLELRVAELGRRLGQESAFLPTGRLRLDF